MKGPTLWRSCTSVFDADGVTGSKISLPLPFHSDAPGSNSTGGALRTSYDAPTVVYGGKRSKLYDPNPKRP